MKVRHFELVDLAGSRLVCWLEDDARLRAGVTVTLEETGARRWRIERRYKTVVESSAINRRWRVGGLL